MSKYCRSLSPANRRNCPNSSKHPIQIFRDINQRDNKNKCTSILWIATKLSSFRRIDDSMRLLLHPQGCRCCCCCCWLRCAVCSYWHPSVAGMARTAGASVPTSHIHPTRDSLEYRPAESGTRPISYPISPPRHICLIGSQCCSTEAYIRRRSGSVFDRIRVTTLFGINAKVYSDES